MNAILETIVLLRGGQALLVKEDGLGSWRELLTSGTKIDNPSKLRMESQLPASCGTPIPNLSIYGLEIQLLGCVDQLSIKSPYIFKNIYIAK